MPGGRRQGDRLRFSAAAGALVVCLLVVWALVGVTVEVRHSAPFGVVRTLDPARSLSVSGGRVTATYDHFDRVDLDLRAYTHTEPGDEIALVVFVQEESEGSEVARTIPLSVPGWQIAADKPAFDDVFTTVRFDPIENSAGRNYYVWVERGPANADDVVTLWSVKSYSRVRPVDVLASFVEQMPLGGPALLRWFGFTVLGVLMLGAFGVALMIFMYVAVRSVWAKPNLSPEATRESASRDISGR